MPKIDSFPELLNSKDLVELGLYPSVDAVYLARLRGYSPNYIKVGRKVLYPKHLVMDFIENNIKDGSTPKNAARVEDNRQAE